jgi:hypothetical protein
MVMHAIGERIQNSGTPERRQRYISTLPCVVVLCSLRRAASPQRWSRAPVGPSRGAGRHDQRPCRRSECVSLPYPFSDCAGECQEKSDNAPACQTAPSRIFHGIDTSGITRFPCGSLVRFALCHTATVRPRPRLAESKRFVAGENVSHKTQKYFAGNISRRFRSGAKSRVEAGLTIPAAPVPSRKLAHKYRNSNSTISSLPNTAKRLLTPTTWRSWRC